LSQIHYVENVHNETISNICMQEMDMGWVGSGGTPGWLGWILVVKS